MAVVGCRTDGAAHMGAVAVVVHRIAVAGDSVGPADEIDAGRIAPHLVGQILVRVADAGVNHRHDDVGGAGGDVPCGHRTDVRARHAVALTEVVKRPKRTVGEGRVIRRGDDGADVIRLDNTRKARWPPAWQFVRAVLWRGPAAARLGQSWLGPGPQCLERPLVAAG